MYIILGCDDVGSAVAGNLSTSGEEIFVIDNDESALIGLKKFNIRTHLADIHTLDLGTLPTKDTIAFVLLQKNFIDNLTLVKRIKKLFPDKFIVSRATGEKVASELQENGVNRVVQTAKFIQIIS